MYRFLVICALPDVQVSGDQYHYKIYRFLVISAITRCTGFWSSVHYQMYRFLVICALPYVQVSGSPVLLPDITVIRNRLDGTIVVDGSEYVNGTAPGLATSMNIDTGLYIGGVPQDISTPRLGTVTYSLDGCIRNLKLQNNVLDVESSTTQVDVTPCTKKVEDAAYFNGNGFLVLDEKFRVGSDLTIDLKFRTTQNDGLLLSVANDQNDCLGLELVNGKLTLRTDNGAGAFSATYTPESSYTLCDNMWHTVKIVKVKNALELVVDGHYQGGANEAVSSSADTNNPLYFAGYPDTALQQKCLTTDIKFMGCIGNVIIQGQKQDFRQAAELVDVRPSSCPVK
ncbi:laminin subunit alpha-2-like [Saccoglossus kowalevskii]|uniref:Laminin subunit alpha-2-like n=1 Tax=Saccoglossus kowalevskii TaxID=10224 RepID=A0ABM0LTL4_SACKO|nr:PREDICTED: laminin subunit alpha-2-like [Saccoglossus kowalevskii]